MLATEPREPDRAVRRLDLRAPARRSPDRGVRRVVAAACPSAGSRSSARTAPASAARSRRDCAGAARTRDRITIRSYVDDATLAALYRARLGVRVSVRVRRLRPDAARGARRRRAAGRARHADRARDLRRRARYVAPTASNDAIAAAIVELLTDRRGARRPCCAMRDDVLAATTGTRGRRRRCRCSRRPPVADSDSLAIIIVTYNSAQEIDACLESLVGHTAPFPTTITVVDNASPDGTAAHVRERWPAVQVIESGGNLGFARANNLGIRATQQRLRAAAESRYDGAARARSRRWCAASRRIRTRPSPARALLSDDAASPSCRGARRSRPWNELKTEDLLAPLPPEGPARRAQDGQAEPAGHARWTGSAARAW